MGQGRRWIFISLRHIECLQMTLNHTYRPRLFESQKASCKFNNVIVMHQIKLAFSSFHSTLIPVQCVSNLLSYNRMQIHALRPPMYPTLNSSKTCTKIRACLLPKHCSELEGGPREREKRRHPQFLRRGCTRFTGTCAKIGDVVPPSPPSFSPYLPFPSLLSFLPFSLSRGAHPLKSAREVRGAL